MAGADASTGTSQKPAGWSMCSESPHEGLGHQPRGGGSTSRAYGAGTMSVPPQACPPSSVAVKGAHTSCLRAPHVALRKLIPFRIVAGPHSSSTQSQIIIPAVIHIYVSRAVGSMLIRGLLRAWRRARAVEGRSESCQARGRGGSREHENAICCRTLAYMLLFDV